jgi:predicted nuclease of predicted toxin-antitoxin system
VPFLLDNDVPDVVARVLVEAGHEVFLRNVLPKKSVDSTVLDYATANALVLITCNRDDFIPLASTRAHSGLIILIRRRSRILECAKLLRLLESAGDSGLAGNINFA